MLISLIICISTNIIPNANEVQAATDKLIRLHVIANSDSETDQEIKLIVRDAVLSKADTLLSSCDNNFIEVTVLSSDELFSI